MERSPLRYLTEQEAARLLRVSTRTLQRWRREGGGPRYRRLGPRRIVYAGADLDAFADGRAFANTSQEGTGSSPARPPRRPLR